MSPSIAGATTTGADVARQVAVTTSAASPCAMAPSQWAVAGATTTTSAASAVITWPIRPSGSRSRTSASHRPPAERRQGERRDEARRRRRHEHHHVGALGAQEAQQVHGLERGDRAGDAERDEASGEAPGLAHAWASSPATAAVEHGPAP